MTLLLPPTPALLCHRDATGAIDALSRQPLSALEQLDGGWQEISADHPEVEAFARLGADNDNVLSRTDIGLIRVLEDLIDTLISRGLIQFTDLPATAQAKLSNRRQIRAALYDPLQLLPLSDNDFDLRPDRSDRS